MCNYDRVATVELRITKDFDEENGLAEIRPCAVVNTGSDASTYVVDSGRTYVYDAMGKAWHVSHRGDSPAPIKEKEIQLQIERFFRFYSGQSLFSPGYVTAVRDRADRVWKYGPKEPERQED